MAENDAGFVFVDKRKVVDGDEAGVAGNAAPIESPSPEKRTDTADHAVEANGDEFAGETPNVYLLLQYCVKLLAADAWRKMGLLADPRTGSTDADLPQAKVAIDAVKDLIDRIETAPEAIVSSADRRDLRTLLNDLRLNYVNQRSAT